MLDSLLREVEAALSEPYGPDKLGPRLEKRRNDQLERTRTRNT